MIRVLALVVAVLAACGGGGGSDPDSPTIDGPPIEHPPPSMTELTVMDDRYEPLKDVWVFWQVPGASTTFQAQTDAAGIVEFEQEVSQVTIAMEGTQNRRYLRTFAGVTPGQKLLIITPESTQRGAVDITVPNLANAASYSVHVGACDTRSAGLTMPLNLDGRCVSNNNQGTGVAYALDANDNIIDISVPFTVTAPGEGQPNGVASAPSWQNKPAVNWAVNVSGISSDWEALASFDHGVTYGNKTHFEVPESEPLNSLIANGVASDSFVIGDLSATSGGYFGTIALVDTSLDGGAGLVARGIHAIGQVAGTNLTAADFAGRMTGTNGTNGGAPAVTWTHTGDAKTITTIIFVANWSANNINYTWEMYVPFAASGTLELAKLGDGLTGWTIPAQFDEVQIIGAGVTFAPSHTLFLGALGAGFDAVFSRPPSTMHTFDGAAWFSNGLPN